MTIHYSLIMETKTKTKGQGTMITTEQLDDIWFETITVWIKEYDEDGELLFTFNKAFRLLAEAAEYATAYHKGRLEYSGGSYQLAFTRK